MVSLNLVVRYFDECLEGELPYSVTVSGERDAAQLPRDHPDWVNWGIDVLEASGSILPFASDDDDDNKSAEEIAMDMREDAKIRRDHAIEAPIIVYGVSWQVAVLKDEPRILRTIDTAKIESYPDDYMVNWILTDNSVRPTTRFELEGVLVAKSMREKDIFEQYGAWMLAGMITPFIVDDSKEY